MKVAIHQPQYFPWLGYFDKIAKVDKFLIMDDVQFLSKSIECRNTFIDVRGIPKILTVYTEKKDRINKKIRDIKICECDKWQMQHLNFFRDTYRRSKYKQEVLDFIRPIFEKKYIYLLDVLVDSIFSINKMLDINTPIFFQSDLNYSKVDPIIDKDVRRNQEVLNMCFSMGATLYITGTGYSPHFLNCEKFEKAGIELLVQNYTCPIYPQEHTNVFVPNISALDSFFSCGVEYIRRCFHENIKQDFSFLEYSKFQEDIG